MSKKTCRDCTLPIHEYKQVIQLDEEVCENCQITSTGDTDYDSEED